MERMESTFITFRPKDPLLQGFVDYYYLDLKPDNQVTEFVCFPHFNNTISLYKSHRRAENQDMIFEEKRKPFQIFTPVREDILEVRQIGPVHRIVIVFHLLGIQQFYRELDFSDYLMEVPFFEPSELDQLFGAIEITAIGELLDQFLQKRYQPFQNAILESAIRYLFEQYEDFSVTQLADALRISRRHLNRLFKTHFGVSVKKFHEIIILRKILEAKLFNNPNESFTSLAYEFNFSDQAHLNKTFKKLTQNAPNQFFKKGTLLGHGDPYWHILKDKPKE